MKTEKIFAGIFLVGLLFKLMYWPFSGVLLVVSLGSIATMYFPAAFYFFSDKKISRQNVALSIISGLFLAFVVLGILFKLMYWPSSHLYLLIGTYTTPILLIITHLLKSKATEELKVYYKNMFLRIIILALLCVTFFLTPTSTLLKIQHRNDPELARLKALYFSDNTNMEYKKQLDDYVRKQDSLKAIEEVK
jgi:hypothetical protein